MYTEEDLTELEALHPEGVASSMILSTVEGWGVKFSEASLRKWVQLELLPRSVRVGHRGALAGSQGLYPATIVRRILEIKGLLSDGFSVEEIKVLGLGSQIGFEALEQQIESVLSDAERVLSAQCRSQGQNQGQNRGEDVSREHARRELRAARLSAEELVNRLKTVQARMARWVQGRTGSETTRLAI